MIYLSNHTLMRRGLIYSTCLVIY